MSEVRPPPLRALGDFLLGPARLAAPDPRDPQRWRNRVLNNLLYYQSNYGLGLGLALLLGGYFRPLHTLLSGSAVTLVFVAFVWAAENKGSNSALPEQLSRRQPPGRAGEHLRPGVPVGGLEGLPADSHPAHLHDSDPRLLSPPEPQE
ncbi:unnamed protein product [Eretmochelys imbricata]